MRRHVDLVYSTALHLVFDAHLAKGVAQVFFIDARARSLGFEASPGRSRIRLTAAKSAFKRVCSPVCAKVGGPQFVSRRRGGAVTASYRLVG